MREVEVGEKTNRRSPSCVPLWKCNLRGPSNVGGTCLVWSPTEGVP